MDQVSGLSPDVGVTSFRGITRDNYLVLGVKGGCYRTNAKRRSSKD
jgi:hypothetical protein